MVRRIYFDVLVVKGFKVKFEDLEKSIWVLEKWIWVLEKSWKSPEICFGKRERSLATSFIYKSHNI